MSFLDEPEEPARAVDNQRPAHRPLAPPARLREFDHGERFHHEPRGGRPRGERRDYDRREPRDRRERASKVLSCLLRHREEAAARPDGFMQWEAVLQHEMIRGKFSSQQLVEAVLWSHDGGAQRRFEMAMNVETDGDGVWVRALMRHTNGVRANGLPPGVTRDSRSRADMAALEMARRYIDPRAPRVVPPRYDNRGYQRPEDVHIPEGPRPPAAQPLREGRPAPPGEVQQPYPQPPLPETEDMLDVPNPLADIPPPPSMDVMFADPAKQPDFVFKPVASDSPGPKEQNKWREPPGTPSTEEGSDTKQPLSLSRLRSDTSTACSDGDSQWPPQYTRGIGKALGDFNGDEWSEDHPDDNNNYISFSSGDEVALLVHEQDEDEKTKRLEERWAFGVTRSSRVSGWFPEIFVSLSADA
eukprot:TRINITY_DN6468_c0_g1_i5.p1 TRINITY_DN6468_c0_g1~~TRINITY_DN6468_c0_g1_i5.p1  ORF type:complete len:414 (+),score=69.39 TRINITY_DN6468_c0_g1_i5:113-1354(+)